MTFLWNLLVENDSKVPGRIKERDVVRAKSNRVREENGGMFQARRNGKEKSFCFVVVQFQLIFGHPCFYVVCARTEFFREVGHFTVKITAFSCSMGLYTSPHFTVAWAYTHHRIFL